MKKEARQSDEIQYWQRKFMDKEKEHYKLERKIKDLQEELKITQKTTKSIRRPHTQTAQKNDAQIQTGTMKLLRKALLAGETLRFGGVGSLKVVPQRTGTRNDDGLLKLRLAFNITAKFSETLQTSDLRKRIGK